MYLANVLGIQMVVVGEIALAASCMARLAVKRWLAFGAIIPQDERGRKAHFAKTLRVFLHKRLPESIRAMIPPGVFSPDELAIL